MEGTSSCLQHGLVASARDFQDRLCRMGWTDQVLGLNFATVSLSVYFFAFADLKKSFD